MTKKEFLEKVKADLVDMPDEEKLDYLTDLMEHLFTDEENKNG